MRTSAADGGEVGGELACLLVADLSGPAGLVLPVGNGAVRVVVPPALIALVAGGGETGDETVAGAVLTRCAEGAAPVRVVLLGVAAARAEPCAGWELVGGGGVGEGLVDAGFDGEACTPQETHALVHSPVVFGPVGGVLGEHRLERCPLGERRGVAGAGAVAGRGRRVATGGEQAG